MWEPPWPVSPALAGGFFTTEPPGKLSLRLLNAHFGDYFGQHFLSHTWVWYFREGNGTPLQYSCLEKSHGRRSLEGCSPWGHWGLDTTERLHFHFSLSCVGEGNGNPLHCSCLENPRDGRAWWAAVYGVAQSQTRLKRLSSSSSVVFNSVYRYGIWHFLLFFVFIILPLCFSPTHDIL